MSIVAKRYLPAVVSVIASAMIFVGTMVGTMVGTTARAEDITVDFESAPTGRCHSFSSTLTTQGFLFTSSDDILVSCDGSLPGYASNGSAALLDRSRNSKPEMEADDGRAFDLWRFDAAVREVSEWRASPPNKGEPGSGTYRVSGAVNTLIGVKFVGSRNADAHEVSYFTWDVSALNEPAEKAWVHLNIASLSFLGDNRIKLIEVRPPRVSLSVLETGFGSFAALTTGPVYGVAFLIEESSDLTSIYLNEMGLDAVNKARIGDGLFTLAFHMPKATMVDRLSTLIFVKILTAGTTLELESYVSATPRNVKSIVVRGTKSNGTWVFSTHALEGIVDGPGGGGDFERFWLPGTFTDLKRVQFRAIADDTSRFSHFFLDNVQVTTIPEPDLGLLQLFAVPVTLWLARRRPRKWLECPRKA